MLISRDYPITSRNRLATLDNIKIQRYTIDTLHEQFPNDDACLDFMFNQHYGSLAVCPKCGVVKPHNNRVRNRKCYACNDCGYQLSPLANNLNSVRPFNLLTMPVSLVVPIVPYA